MVTMDIKLMFRIRRAFAKVMTYVLTALPVFHLPLFHPLSVVKKSTLMSLSVCLVSILQLYPLLSEIAHVFIDCFVDLNSLFYASLKIN